MSRLLILIAICSLVFANVASAVNHCCFEDAQQNVLEASNDEPCHESMGDATQEPSEEDSNHQCQCEFCPQAENTIEHLDTPPDLYSATVSSPLAKFSSLDPDRIEHPPRPIS